MGSIRRAKPSQLDTLLVRTDSESWRVPTSHQVLTDKTPLLSLPRHQLLLLLPQYSQLLQLPRPLTTTMLMSQLTPTSTHSSTPMTQPTVTSDSTPTEPNLPQSLLLRLLTLEFLPVLIVPE